jgi:glycosyltransferase involved in cell wall biosynthesis
MRQAMKFAARKAWISFAISEATRQDAIRLFNMDPGKIHNIYGGASSEYRRIQDPGSLDLVRSKYSLVEPFIFYPASVSPRKNFARILQAFQRVQGEIPHHLYFTGHIGWNTSELEQPLQRLSQRVHRLGLVPADDMAAIYSLAQFAIYPSLFEGLGLPILEAFQCGTPLMTSNQSSLPEVAGEAALIVDAYNVDSIAQGLLEMARNEGRRKRLASAGYERVRRFTWEKSVASLLGAIEDSWDR